jgi:CheY-like chemotaxis protein
VVYFGSFRRTEAPACCNFRTNAVDCIGPFALEAVVPTDPEPVPDSPGQVLLQGRRVLVVEDEALIALMVQDTLTEAGAEVAIVHDAMAALAAFAGGHFDAAVVNPGLPDLSGVVVISRFRAARPRLPVVVTTGSAEKFSADGSLVVGGVAPTAVLEKPFDPIAIVEVLADLIAASERGVRQ